MKPSTQQDTPIKGHQPPSLLLTLLPPHTHQGIESWRVDLLPLQSANVDHLSAYNLMDISLDTWPYAGRRHLAVVDAAAVAVVVAALTWLALCGWGAPGSGSSGSSGSPGLAGLMRVGSSLAAAVAVAAVVLAPGPTLLRWPRPSLAAPVAVAAVALAPGPTLLRWLSACLPACLPSSCRSTLPVQCSSSCCNRLAVAAPLTCPTLCRTPYMLQPA